MRLVLAAQAMYPGFDSQWQPASSLSNSPNIFFPVRMRWDDLIIIPRTRVNVWESMGKPCSCMQFKKSSSLLQVTQESISGTASHMRCIWVCNEIEGSYDKIIITIVPSFPGKILLVCCHWYCYSCCTLITINTDNYKHVIFSGIPLHYGDTYMDLRWMLPPLASFPGPISTDFSDWAWERG